jgi:hypothetical protein
VGRGDAVTTAIIPAELAAFAWGMMSRAEYPFPPPVAVDWLREACGTDDVDAVKRALYQAAADELEGGSSHATDTGSWAAGQLRQGRFDSASRDISGRDNNDVISIRDWLPDANLSEASKASVLAWCDRAEAFIELCRAVEAA